MTPRDWTMNGTADTRLRQRQGERPFRPGATLGPNQLSWLRRHIAAFKFAEEQRNRIRQEEIRVARAAGVYQ